MVHHIQGAEDQILRRLRSSMEITSPEPCSSAQQNLALLDIKVTDTGRSSRHCSNRAAAQCSVNSEETRKEVVLNKVSACGIRFPRKTFAGLPCRDKAHRTPKH